MAAAFLILANLVVLISEASEISPRLAPLWKMPEPAIQPLHVQIFETYRAWETVIHSIRIPHGDALEHTSCNAVAVMMLSQSMRDVRQHFARFYVRGIGAIVASQTAGLEDYNASLPCSVLKKAFRRCEKHAQQLLVRLDDRVANMTSQLAAPLTFFSDSCVDIRARLDALVDGMHEVAIATLSLRRQELDNKSWRGISAYVFEREWRIQEENIDTLWSLAMGIEKVKAKMERFCDAVADAEFEMIAKAVDAKEDIFENAEGRRGLGSLDWEVYDHCRQDLKRVADTLAW